MLSLVVAYPECKRVVELAEHLTDATNQYKSRHAGLLIDKNNPPCIATNP